MTLLRSAVCALACAVLACPPALAQWTWRDAGGRVVASDRPPPPSVPERDILRRPAGADAPRVPAPPLVVASPASAPASAPVAARPAEPELEARKRRADEEAEARRRATQQAEAARKQAEEQRLAAQRADNCGRAREALRTLQDGVRIARVGADGQREILDDGQRAREVARVQGVIASDCR